MTIRFRNATRTNMADEIVADIDAGAGDSTLKIYTGSVNGTRGSAPAGTLLATLTLAATSGTVSNGVITLGTVTEDSSADDNGTAGCFAIFDGDGNLILDGTVTVTGGGGDLTLNTVSIVAGGPVGITSGTITVGA